MFFTPPYYLAIAVLTTLLLIKHSIRHLVIDKDDNESTLNIIKDFKLPDSWYKYDIDFLLQDIQLLLFIICLSFYNINAQILDEAR